MPMCVLIIRIACRCGVLVVVDSYQCFGPTPVCAACATVKA